jgi:hypothetical protein
MKKNVGGLDKGLRIALGIVLILIGLLAQLSGGIKTLVFLVAAVALFTGVFGLCPLWKVLGISTYKEK